MDVGVPELAARIERRLLVNYRLDAGVAGSLLPRGLRPQLVDGSAVAGVCLLRLGAVRPSWVRPAIGWGAENAAHRIAVEWDDASGTHSGVYIPIRHSASWLPVALGGRVFPGVHRHARFTGNETDDVVRVTMTAEDAQVHAEVVLTDVWRSSLFATLADASEFFRRGSVGWSPGRADHGLKAIALATTQWQVRPGSAIEVHSSFFAALPAGSAELDNVLVMRDVPVTWRVPGGGAPGLPVGRAAT